MFLPNSLLGNLVTLVATFFVLVICYWKWSYQYWRRKNVPYLEPEIPFGNMANVFKGKEFMAVTLKNIYYEMKSRGWKYGGFYTFTKPIYMPIDLELIKNILTKDFQHFNMRYVNFNGKQQLQAHLYKLGGNKWKYIRSKLSPVFTSAKMKMMFTIMAECQNTLQRRIEKECLKKKPIHINEVLACFTTNIIGICAFGLQFNALEDENSRFKKFGQGLLKTSTFGILKRIFFITFPKLAKTFNVLEIPQSVTDFITEMVDNTITLRERNNYTRNDYFQRLIDLKNNPPENAEDNDGQPLTLDEVASQVFLFFLAGFETSSALMTFGLYQLAKHQKIQEQLRKEINTVLGKHDNQMTYDAVQDMKFLSQVIDETLRLHPPMPVLRRKCTKDYKVPNEDIIIEKGTTILIPVVGIQTDKEHYPNPERFDPGRFSEENRKSRHQYAFLPFGGGPRLCIGMRFGLLQAKVGMVSLLKNYKFTVSGKTQEVLVDESNPVFMPAQGEIWLDAQKL